MSVCHEELSSLLHEICRSLIFQFDLPPLGSNLFYDNNNEYFNKELSTTISNCIVIKKLLRRGVSESTEKEVHTIN